MITRGAGNADDHLDRPADIIGRHVPGAAQLDATASVAGVFTYTPAAGTVLTAGANQPLTVTFTPTDTDGLHRRHRLNVTINVIALPRRRTSRGLSASAGRRRG